MSDTEIGLLITFAYLCGVFTGGFISGWRGHR